MTILALEFSSLRRSVALASGEEVLAEAVAQTTGRGTDAFGLIQNVLAKAGLSREAVDVIAVGLGPGSYTGIRAAIAVAQGWQLARGVKLLGVSSVDSVAWQAQAEGLTGLVGLMIDAQRGEFYLSRWDISSSHRKEVEPLKIVSAAEIATRQAAGEIFAGPDAERRLFPSASALARLAAGRTNHGPGDIFEPIYLRETSFVKAPATRAL
jgi:tRNA threonylcarbamoyl adenosine modification protein YeaZ